jgi:hypothetical protein
MKIFLLIAAVFGAHPRITPIDRIQYLSEYFEKVLPAERAVAAQPLSPEDEASVCALVAAFIEANDQTELEKFIPILHAATRLGLARTDFKNIEFTILRHIMSGKKRVASTVHEDAGLTHVTATTPDPIPTAVVAPTILGQKRLKSILVVREDVTGSSERSPSREEIQFVKEIESYLNIPNWRMMVQSSIEMDGFAHTHYKMALALDTHGLSNQLKILRDLGSPGASIAYLFQSAYSVLMNRSGYPSTGMLSPPARPQSRSMMDVLSEVFRDERYQREPMICSNICKHLVDKAREGDLKTIETILSLAIAAGTQSNEMADAFFPAYRILKERK